MANWDYGDQAETQAALVSKKRMSRRQHLDHRRQSLVSDLAAVDKAIAALDAHPELEDFIETLAAVGV